MRDKTFDDFIRQKVFDHSSAVPQDMWSRIAREKERDRKGFAWWRQFAFVAVAAVALLAGWLLVDRQSNDAVAITQAGAGKDAAGNSPSGPVNTAKLQGKNAGLPTDDQTGVMPPGNAGNIHQPVPVGNGNPTDPSRSSLTTTGDGTDRLSTGENRFKSRRNVSQRLSTPGRFVSGQPGLDGSVNMNSATDEIIRKYLLNPETVSQRERGISLRSAALKGYSGPPRYRIECPGSGDPQRGDWYIEVFGGLNFASKSTSLNRTTSTTFLQRKDSSESRQPSFSAGVRFTKEMGENMVFKTGLHYTQINEKFSYKNENERRKTTVVTSRTIYGSQGQVITVTDTSVTEQIGYTETTAYNRFRSLDIPLLLGYEFSLNKWKVGVNAGAMVNIKSWQEGETLDSNFLPMSFSKNKATTYKKNVGLGFYTGLSIIRSLNDRTSLFAEPYLHYNFSSLTNSASIVNEKFKMTGILLGIRYNLSRGKATE